MDGVVDGSGAGGRTSELLKEGGGTQVAVTGVDGRARKPSVCPPPLGVGTTGRPCLQRWERSKGAPGSEPSGGAGGRTEPSRRRRWCFHFCCWVNGSVWSSVSYRIQKKARKV